MNMKLRKFLGSVSQAISPGYSFCGRCGLTWNHVKSHSTFFTPGEGCFPLCEYCWQELKTPEARWPYYLDLIHQWWGFAHADHNGMSWEDVTANIKKAVFEGK